LRRRRHAEEVKADVRVKAVYYCGNCSRAVNAEAAVCPHCGSIFTSVRCPRCGFEGRAAAFRDGCPSCGYLMSREERSRSVSGAVKRTKAGMPGRFYRVSGIILLVLFAILIVLLLMRTRT
jgi:DNA-directed RNA polymerase subunit RPC12/RpoP